jgi:uncharacterized protein (DUF488 family)
LPKVFTVGHSNHPIDEFLHLLATHNIDVVVDVRSSPYSKFSPHYNQENLRLAVKNAGRKYLFLGRELGGMPKDPDLYDQEGYVLYWKIAESDLFEEGIERLQIGIASYTVALMCGEEDPSNCHRRRLVGRVLQGAGFEVLHIRGNGSVQTESELELANGTSTKQMTLFAGTNEEEPWRSVQPVLLRKPL